MSEFSWKNNNAGDKKKTTQATKPHLKKTNPRVTLSHGGPQRSQDVKREQSGTFRQEQSV